MYGGNHRRGLKPGPGRVGKQEAAAAAAPPPRADTWLMTKPGPHTTLHTPWALWLASHSCGTSAAGPCLESRDPRAQVMV